jgi:hypothetical protein
MLSAKKDTWPSQKATTAPPPWREMILSVTLAIVPYQLNPTWVAAAVVQMEFATPPRDTASNRDSASNKVVEAPSWELM